MKYSKKKNIWDLFFRVLWCASGDFSKILVTLFFNLQTTVYFYIKTDTQYFISSDVRLWKYFFPWSEFQDARSALKIGKVSSGTGSEPLAASFLTMQ